MGAGGRGPDCRAHLARVRERQRRIHHHVPRRRLGDRDDGDGPGGVSGLQLKRVSGNQAVAAEVEIALAGRELRRARQRLGGDLQVGHDRAALLREPRLVQSADVAAVDHGRSRQDLRQGGDAGAADPGDAHREARRAEDHFRIRQRLAAGRSTGRLRGRSLGRCAARAGRHGDEGGAIAVQAGEVEVAGRLVDLRLAAELRRDRLDGQAVRLLPAVAAALADALVDEHPLGRHGHLAAAALAPFLRGALLVVDEHGDAGPGCEFLLDRDQLVPVPDVGTAPGRAAQLPRLVSGHHDPPRRPRAPRGCRSARRSRRPGSGRSDSPRRTGTCRSTGRPRRPSGSAR